MSSSLKGYGDETKTKVVNVIYQLGKKDDVIVNALEKVLIVLKTLVMPYLIATYITRMYFRLPEL